ncbi:MAG: hypothetical protein EOO71_09845 [Myxococcaceae bacterium]|nr:MAG: hypothetical protein EOO71_09845 [Myxococcaceae bacterium]
MKMISKTFLAGAAVLFLAPLTASALPLQCDQRCKPTTPCTIVCAVGGFVITCGDYGTCAGASRVAPSEPQASVQPTTTEDADLTCHEPAPEARG